MNRWLASFLRLFFRLLYSSFAWTYDLVAWLVSLGRWKSWVFACLPLLSGPQVLELGSGPGHLQLALAQKGIQVYGLDASRQMVRRSARMLRKHHQLPRLVLGKAPEIPFPAASFDQIVATFPTEYIFQSDTLAAVRRLLRSGGSLIVIPAAWITGDSWLDRLAASLFHITGQAPAWDEKFLIPFSNAGMAVSGQMMDLAGSQVVIIVAQKP